MFVAEENERIDVAELFERFGGKCFKTGIPLDINATDTWHIDHIMPSKYLWPQQSEMQRCCQAKQMKTRRRCGQASSIRPSS